MKKYFTVVLVIVILLISIYHLFVSATLQILTGYAAKDFCSCYYLANRSPEIIKKEDLHFSPVNLATCKVDESTQTVTATVFGLASKKAIYRNGLGCSVLNNENNNEIAKITFSKPTLSNENPDTIAWPYGDQLADTLPNDYDRQKLEKLIENAFDKEGEYLRKTRALIVVHNDQIIGEKYAKGIGQNTPLIGWSMTKSITSTLLGILNKNGSIDPSDNNLIEIWKNDDRAKIQLKHLLRMNSGLQWEENYSKISDATKMLYARDDMFNYAVNVPLDTLPGTKWVYSSGTSNILSGLIKNQFSSLEEYWKFPYDSLFYPLGMRSITMEPDVTGTYVGSSYSYASARDWARLGILYINDGIFNNKRILPEGWVDFSIEPAEGSTGSYGSQIWLNLSKDMPDCPESVYYFDGYNGQRVFIVPSKDLIVVRLGISKTKEEFDFNTFLSEVIATIK